MIVAYEGLLGSGKTYGMVRSALMEFRRCQPQVFCNMSALRFPEAIYVDDLGDITGLYNGLFMLDEASVCLPSRYWQSVSRECLGAFAQMRKNGLDLYYTTQNMARVDTVLRELTSTIVRCRRIGKLFVAVATTPDGKTITGRKIYPFSRSVGELYDTYELIGTHGGGGELGAAAARRTIARRRLAETGNRATARRADGVQLLRSFDGHQFRLTRQAQEVRDWLVAEGVMSAGAWNWQERVREEIQRRAWLVQFGLTVDDVPLGCCPQNSWLADYSPGAVKHRKELLQLEQAETVVRVAQKKGLKLA